MSKSEKEVKQETAATPAFELKSETKVEDGGMATITYDKTGFNNFIGETLKEAVVKLGEKTDEYFKLVVDDSTNKSAELFKDENVKVISIEAPIGNSKKDDKLEILHVRDEVEAENFEDINVKITSNISSPSVLRGAAAVLKKKA